MILLIKTKYDIIIKNNDRGIALKKSKKDNKNKALIFAVVIVMISFLCAVKVLSSIVTIHYENEKTVCLDAGHGGSDVGATLKSERLEKDDNLRLTLAVKEKLNKRGIKTVLTRNDDSEIDLKDRCRLANKKRCDLFVSLHRNSSVTDGSGFEAWISKDEKGNEKTLAIQLVDNLSKTSNLNNRGVKNGYRTNEANNYYVNANTNMPSILLEVGFITNDKDNLSFDQNLDKYAQIIADSIYNYLK